MEIEKMYEKAGIKICKRKQGFTLKDCTDRDCRECGYYDIPPFTAEKQIKLMDKMIDKGMLLITGLRNRKGMRKVTGFYRGGKACCSIGDSLANYVCEAWQDLTEEERKQIKDILE